MKYEVNPIIGVGSVKLGMSRADVRSIMNADPHTFKKTPTSKHDTDAWHNSGFQVFYRGEVPTVEFIELSRDSGIVALYKGIDVFNTVASKLIKKISEDDVYDASDPELGYSYLFPNLEMSLWRPIKPESLEDDEGKYFSTIGVGVEGYYSQEPHNKAL
jgi:hypothetical protein